jgi:pyruvate,water dikinase
MRLVPLEHADDRGHFGGKAVGLGAALRARLPVPGGYALSVELVDAIAKGDAAAESHFAATVNLDSDGALAVRSSAADEDSRAASFAGQHLTRLNVRASNVLAAARDVWASGRTPGALRYRQRLGLPPEPRVAVVVQRMVRPTCAGVLFTCDPRTGEDVRVIEGSWGLGEAVVSGLVSPDRVIMERGGAVRMRHVERKDIAVEACEEGTREVEVPSDIASSPCFTTARLAALEALAQACESHFEGPSDIEWAFEGDSIVLLQRRAVTR